ncbi:DUF6089 family protein [Parabacteroides sp. PF5-9]|uniref:type IX secretion system protein PorG n=1 Tax=Parabacteroides sp. PF5-9 TaxID=1742404 RepID=UPI0032AF110B
MTSTFFQRLLFIVLIVGITPALRAQEYKYEIGGMGGGAFYMGDLNKGTPFKGLNPALGGVFRYNANLRWALKADLMWAKVSGNTDGLTNVFPENAQVSFDRNVIEIGAQGEFNFFPYSDQFSYMGSKRITPYALLGAGVSMATGSGDSFVSPHLSIGAGVKYKIKNRLNLGCEFSFRKLLGDGLEGDERLKDPYEIGTNAFKNNDWYSCLMFSVTWDFGPCNKACNNINSITGY